MTCRAAVGVVVACALLGQPLELMACGDKFLVASRGTRFQRAGLVRRPAAVLVYAAPGRFATVLQSLGVLDALRKVGYTPTAVTDRAAFDRALRDQRFDLVLADLADSVAMTPGPGTAPAVVVVAFDANRDALTRARRLHDGVIKVPGRARAVIDAVDDALFARAVRAPLASRTGN